MIPAFSPLTGLSSMVRSLFSAGEPGVWLDPSDLSTLFQDAAGTVPVTAVGQPVGLILDKSKGLVLGPELVVRTNSLSGWASPITTNPVLENGQIKISFSGNSFAAYSYLRTPNLSQNLKIGVMYRVSGKVRVNTGGNVNVDVYSGGAVGGAGSNITSEELISFSYVVIPQSSDIYLMVTGMNAGETIWLTGISVREIPGNHATQATTTSRPTLSARINLLEKTEQFNDAAWSKTNATIAANAVVAPDETTTADTFIPDAGTVFGLTSGVYFNSLNYFYQGVSVAAATYKYRLRVKDAGYDMAQLRVSESSSLSGTNQAQTRISLNTGVVNSQSSTGNLTNVTGACARTDDGWCDITLTFTSGAAQTLYFGIWAWNTTAITSDGVKGLHIWGADLRVANESASLPAYQRVNTSTDYDTVGFPYYLLFDGVDDSLVTGNIDFTATDKMTVLAGVRKNSDAAPGIVVELSADRSANAGAFSLYAPAGGSNQYLFASRGTVDGAWAVVSPRTYPTPQTAVLTGIGNISGDQSLLRVNGSTAATAGAFDQGTGNYGNYPLYIGRRGGTTMPFNGRLYGLIVRGAATDDLHLTHAERYLAYKSGVTL